MRFIKHASTNRQCISRNKRPFSKCGLLVLDVDHIFTQRKCSQNLKYLQLNQATNELLRKTHSNKNMKTSKLYYLTIHFLEGHKFRQPNVKSTNGDWLLRVLVAKRSTSVLIWICIFLHNIAKAFSD